jgi:hypothetical protein
MGELFDSLRSVRRPSRRPVLIDVIEKLSPEDRDDLIKALNTHTIPAAAIREALAKRGIDISVSVVYRYRTGEYDHVFK